MVIAVSGWSTMPRNWMIRIRATRNEVEELRMLASGAGFVTVSAYVRHCCFVRQFWAQGKLVELGDALEEIRALLEQRTAEQITLHNVRKPARM